MNPKLQFPQSLENECEKLFGDYLQHDHDPSKTSTSQHLQAIVLNKYINTNDLARGLGILPQSIRKRFSQTGEYFGIRPMKMANGRLFWPMDFVEKLSKAN